MRQEFSACTTALMFVFVQLPSLSSIFTIDATNPVRILDLRLVGCLADYYFIHIVQPV